MLYPVPSLVVAPQGGKNESIQAPNEGCLVFPASRCGRTDCQFRPFLTQLLAELC
jgi:hypothetical protein